MKKDLKYIQKNKLYVGSGVEDLLDSNLHTSLDEYGQYGVDYGAAKNETIAKVVLNSDDSRSEDQLAETIFSDITKIEHDVFLGYYSDLYVGYVQSDNFRKNGSSGGFVSWMAVKLMEKSMVDGIIHVKQATTPGLLFEYGISRTIEEVRSGAKSKYYPTELSKVLKEVKQRPGKYAVVGIPEFIAELRLLAENDRIINERIKYYLGLVCGHQKTTKYAEAIAWEQGMKPGDLKNIDFRVKKESGSALEYDMQLTGIIDGRESKISIRNDKSFISHWGHGFFKARFSDFTDDSFNELADITFGDAWLEEYVNDPMGNNILILRNEELASLIKESMSSGELKLDEVDKETILRSQQGLIHHTRDELPYRLHKELEREKWAPKKRVEPSDELTGHRKKVQDVRQNIAEKSHTYYREAVEKGDFEYFKEKMQPFIDEYQELYVYQSGNEVRTFQLPAISGDDLKSLYAYDEERFRKSYISDIQAASQNQLTHRLMISTHSLEKGLSNDGFEIGHGFTVIQRLITFLDIYKAKRYDQSHIAFINTLSALKEFYLRHQNTEWVSKVEALLGAWLPIIQGYESAIGGATEVVFESKKHNDKKGFKELAEDRFSVRTYSNQPVDKKDIEEAIAIAAKSPSVCNRQPVRVHAMFSKDVIASVLEVQGGIAFYDTPPVLLLVTADDNSYMGANERNQGFVDGGLFAMSVLYALEYMKLAACPLHAMFDIEKEMIVRGLLNIPDNEKLITFISVGHFKDINNVCKSVRYPTDYFLTEVERIHEFRIESGVPVPLTVPESLAPPAVVEVVSIKSRIHHKVKHASNTLGAYLDRRQYEKAEGAILTLTGYLNYGNVLQRYALQKYLRKNGHNFVSYVDSYSVPRNMYHHGRKKKLKTPLRALKRFLNYQKPYWYLPKFSEIYPEAVRLGHIIDFVNKNIWIKPYDPRDEFNTYIVGSDQVWRNWWENREILGYYFFDFLKGRKVKRIAYAASFGKDKIEEVMSEDDVEYIRPYIGSFDNISVREKSGTKMIHETWGIKDVTEAVDPTLLLEAADYSELIDNSDVKYEKIQPIFAYIISETLETDEFMRRVQDDRKQPVTKVRAHGGTENDVMPPVELWLKGFRDAELVVTNSFHGMMFSVINNTDFIIMGRENGGLSRIQDFLSKYGIEGRFVDEDGLSEFKLSELKPIDWEAVNSKLGERCKESGEWLLQSIEQQSNI